jgi:transcriptional regulator with XRE-family HTH domain
MSGPDVPKQRPAHADSIREIRRQSKLTQKQLAERLKVTRGAVARWENGSHDPKEENYIALSDLAYEQGLSALGGFFRSMVGARKLVREEILAERYLKAVEKEAASGFRPARSLLEFSRMEPTEYYRKVLDAMNHALANLKESDSLIVIAQRFEEAWRVTTLRLGHQCRMKKQEIARLRNASAGLEKSSAREWDQKRQRTRRGNSVD